MTAPAPAQDAIILADDDIADRAVPSEIMLAVVWWPPFIGKTAQGHQIAALISRPVPAAFLDRPG